MLIFAKAICQNITNKGNKISLHNRATYALNSRVTKEYNLESIIDNSDSWLILEQSVTQIALIANSDLRLDAKGEM